MKKRAFLPAAVLLLALLTACGGDTSPESDLPAEETTTEETVAEESAEPEATLTDEMMIGTWQGTFTADGTVITRTLKLYQGGTGEMTSVSEGDPSDHHFSGTWELVDGALNFSYLSTTQGYLVAADADPLTMVLLSDDRIVLEKQSES